MAAVTTAGPLGSWAGIASTLWARLLYPRIAAEVVALPKYSALCHFLPCGSCVARLESGLLGKSKSTTALLLLPLVGPSI